MANLEKLARENKIAIVHEIRGKDFSWDGVEAQFLWPEIVPEEIGPAPKNNDSLVLRLKYGERTLLLPGDAEKQAESAMLDENSETALHADVLKVGHHGSKNSTMPEFLAAVHPRVAVISAGEDNPYGHPNPELLERLANGGGADSADGPRRRGACFDRRETTRSQLLRGVSRDMREVRLQRRRKPPDQEEQHEQ